MRSLALYALFFLSGGAALAYQIVWARMFTIGLGHEVSAVLAIVTAFMGGMALGAWLLARPIARTAQPGRWFGVLEIVIGVWGALSVLVVPVANDLALQLIGPASIPSRQWLVTFLVPGIAILPATFAMGATFVAAERFLRSMARGPVVGAVYAANTLGAVSGTLLATFVVMPVMGIRNTALACAVINLACGVVALLIAKRSANSAVSERSANARLKCTLAAAGFLGIGYEVVGIRALSTVLDNTVYTFALALAVFLLGTALGGAFYQRSAARAEKFLIGCIGLACAAGLWPMFFSRELHNLLPSEAAVAMLVFVVPSACMGALFSHLVQSAAAAGLPLGRALAANTLGAAIAPAVFGVSLLPILGSRGTAVLIVTGYLLLILARWKITLAAAIVALPILWINDDAWHKPNEKVMAYREGRTASVAVLESPDGHRTLRINNRFQQGGTAAANAEYRHAHIPLLLHNEPRSALFLGLGTGITLGGATQHPALRIDGVDLIPEVLAVMPHFASHNFGAWTNPTVRLIVADARRFAKATTNQYDVVVADLFHPAMDGAGLLYTREHFAAVRAQLAKDGLFCQWLPLYQLDASLVRVISRTFTEVFPHSEAWLLRFNIDTPVLGLIGFLEPPKFPANWIETRLQPAQLRDHIGQLALADSIRFFGNQLLDEKSLARFCEGAIANTDDRPIVMFDAPRIAHRKPTSYDTLLTLLDLPRSQPADAKAAAYMRARDVYFRALVAEAEGREERAIEGFIASAKISEDFTLGYARCITISSLLANSQPAEAKQLLERLVEAQPSQPLAKEMLARLFGPK